MNYVQKKASDVGDLDLVRLPGDTLATIVAYVESNPDVPGNVLITHFEGTYECPGDTLIDVEDS